MLRLRTALLLGVSMSVLAAAAAGQIGCKEGEILRGGVCEARPAEARPAAQAAEDTGSGRSADAECVLDEDARPGDPCKAKAKKKSNVVLPATLGTLGGVALLVLLDDDGSPAPPGPPPRPACTGYDIVNSAGNACVPCPADALPNADRTSCVTLTCTDAHRSSLENRVCRAPRPPQGGSCDSATILLGGRCTRPNIGLVAAATSLTAWRANLAFNAQPALRVVRAHYAYGGDVDAPVYNGAGVQTAIVGDGVSRHPVFQDASGGGYARLSRIDSLPYVGLTPPAGGSLTVNATDVHLRGRWPGGNSGNTGNADATLRERGTAAASILAGYQHTDATAVASSQLGIAPGARILDVPYEEFRKLYCASGEGRTPDCSVGAQTGVETTEDSVRNHWGLLGAAVKAAVDHESRPKYILLPVRQQHIPSTAVSGWSEDDRDLAWLLAQPLVNAIVSDTRDDATRPVFVVGTGDHRIALRCAISACSTTDRQGPHVMAQLPKLAATASTLGIDQDIEDWFLAVIPTQGGTDLEVEQFHSGRCGATAEWCLAAPGRGLRAATGTDGYYQAGAPFLGGSEFAAALVTGALALVDQAFSTADGASVSPRDVRKRLLDTTLAGGQYANTAVYGAGHLNIETALTPQGSMGASAPPLPGSSRTSVRGPTLPAAGLGFALPAETLAQLGDMRLMTLDSQGFPFYARVAGLAYAAPRAQDGFVPIAAPGAMRKGFGFSAGDGTGWVTALAPRHMVDDDGTGGVSADAHLSLSPLMSSSLGGGARHLALQAQLGASTLGVMACEQRRSDVSPLVGLQSGDKSGCMALSLDWNPNADFGLTLRTHRLDTRRGLYGYGPRCGLGSCADGAATATEVGLGGFARVANGLRFGWNYWQGLAADGARAGYLGYGDLRHSGASLALGAASGAWSFYLQQPLQTSGRLRLQLPSRRTPYGQVHFRSYDFAVRSGARHLRLGFSGRLSLTRRGGFLHLNLGGESGLDGQAGAVPYGQLEARIPW